MSRRRRVSLPVAVVGAGLAFATAWAIYVAVAGSGEQGDQPTNGQLHNGQPQDGEVPSSSGHPPQTASAPVVSSALPVEPISPIDRVRLKALDAKPPGERTVAEALELARGHRRLMEEQPSQWRALAMEDDQLARDPTQLRRLRAAVEDPVTTIEAIEAAAHWPAEVGIDVLFDVRVAQRPAELEPEQLALLDDVLMASEVRSRASEALNPTLALRAAIAHGSCYDVKETLVAVIAKADDRGATALERLDVKVGCGAEGLDDCYGCLRSDDYLERAHAAAGGRAYRAPYR